MRKRFGIQFGPSCDSGFDTLAQAMAAFREHVHKSGSADAVVYELRAVARQKPIEIIQLPRSKE